MTKRSIDEISAGSLEDEVDKFIRGYSDNLKDMVTRLCSSPGCTDTSWGYGVPRKNTAAYGVLGENKTVCKKHADPTKGEVLIGSNCRHATCKKKGTLGIRGSSYKFCAPCIDDCMIPAGLPEEAAIRTKGTGPKCEFEGCKVVAGYGGKKRCKTHSLPGEDSDEKVVGLRLCVVPSCTDDKRRRYGFEGGKPTHCKEHGRMEGMIDLSGVKCWCKKRASYRKPGGKLEYCGNHKPEGYILQIRECEEDKCTAQPSYGEPGSEEYTHCSEHAPPGYEDVRNKRCAHQGCGKNRSFGSESGPDAGTRMRCYEHKKEGDINLVETMCAMACCVDGGPPSKFMHPEYNLVGSEFYHRRICSFARRALVEDAMMNNDTCRVESLMAYFKMETILTLNAQSAFRVACEKNYYKLLNGCEEIIFDRPAKEGPKTVGDKRPDIFYKWIIGDKKFGIHIEYDERSGHEEEDGRIEYIAKDAGCEGNVYLIRVQGKQDSASPMCVKKTRVTVVYWDVTEFGKEVAIEVADEVKKRIGWIQRGLSPNEERPYIIWM
jgi:hypothetical protein